MTPTEATHGPESHDGRQDTPGATEAREAIDLDAIEAQARHWDHLIRDDPATTLALVRDLREARAEVVMLHAQQAVLESERDNYRDAFLRMNDACTVREAAVLDLQAEADDLRARLAEVEALAAAVVKADDDSVSYEPCADCLRGGVAVITGESYDATDAAIEALRAALRGDR